VKNERQIKYEVIVNASAMEVWEAWTTPEGIATFFAPASTVELTPGGVYEIYFFPDNPPGKRGAEGTKVLSFLPGRMFSFNWDAPPQLPVARANMKTIVVLLFTELTQRQTKVELINHHYLSGGEYDKAFEYFTTAWATVMERLKSRFEEGPRVWAVKA
jgi:uncharacterized protein YndB with AHSA1/START domain